MKKIFCAIVLAFCFALALFPAAALAAPWLVSDPTPPGDEVTKFRLSFDSGAYVDSAPDANGAVRYDLAGIVEGSHTVVGQACNVWGCSADSSPFSFTKRLPGAPGLLRIAP